MDLARYADSNGYEGDPEYYHTWRYRDYVIDAFNDDKPYDQFIKEQIAGNEFAVVRGARVLPPPDPEKVVAMTFLRLAPFTEPRGERSRHELLTEMTSTVESVFLGLTVGCTQCHDHKYDPIPTDDFYRMKTFFATTQIAPPRPGDIQQLGGPQPAAFYRPGEKDWADKAREKYQKGLDELETQFSEFNQPLIERLTAIRKETKGDSDRTPNPEKDGKDDAEPTADDLSKAFQEERENPGEKQHFCVEEEKQFRSFKKRILRLKNAILRVEASAMSVSTADGPPYGPSVPETYVLTRGQWDNPGKGVEPGFLRAIEGHANPAELVKVDRYQRHPGHGRRMTLANWIASPDNPLTARVMVNRLWQYRFGRGIIETSSDFGKNGAYELAFRMQAGCPELLDFSPESAAIRVMYGLDQDPTRPFATNCLLARRMVERGVRFVQLFHKGWDNHANLKRDLKKQCDITDQPAAALLKDLKQRGLLDEPLVVWGSEFGRTPMVENRKPDQADSLGRDHHRRAFSIWMAGGGIKGGLSPVIEK